MAKTKLKAVVISSSGPTAKVVVENQNRHPIYGKVRKFHKSFLADCTGYELHGDDLVEILAVAPISKRKAWKVIRIVEKK